LFQLREYTLTEYYEDDIEVKFINNDKLRTNYATNNPKEIYSDKDLNEDIAEKRKEMNNQRYR